LNLKHHELLVPGVIVPCLLASTDLEVMNKALDMLAEAFSVILVTPSLVKGLIRSMDPALKGNLLKAIGVFKELVEAVSETGSLVETLKDDQGFLLPLVFEKLIRLLESSNEQLSSLALSTLEVAVRALPYSPLSAQVLR
jgi:hypothetical protein